MKNDNYVLVGIYNRVLKPDDEQYFHFICWVDYFNRCVERKMKANIRFMQERAVQVFEHPMSKNLLSQIQGSDVALNMLKTPLDEKKVNYIKRINKKNKMSVFNPMKYTSENSIIQKIADKIQNARKQRSGKKRKNKMQ